MPLDEDEVREVKNEKNEVAQKTHGLIREAIDPKKALKQMKKDEYEGGVAFSAEEVKEYIKQGLRQSAQDNPRSSYWGGIPDKPFDEQHTEAADEFRDNLQYIAEKTGMDNGIVGGIIGDSGYSDSDFKSYIEDRLWDEEDVETIVDGKKTYFKA